MAISFFSLFANMQKFTTPPTYFRPSNAKTPRQAERRRKKKTKRKEKKFQERTTHTICENFYFDGLALGNIFGLLSNARFGDSFL